MFVGVCPPRDIEQVGDVLSARANWTWSRKRSIPQIGKGTVESRVWVAHQRPEVLDRACRC